MVECGNFLIKEEPLLGEKPRSERIFYYVRMEDMVPENQKKGKRGRFYLM
jgi:hypothetical protein